MKILDRLEEWIIASLMAGATFIIFIAVLHRYLSGLPIPGLQDWLIAQNTSWAQELSTFMFVWMAKFGAAYGVRTGIHVGVDVLINRLSERWRNKLIVRRCWPGPCSPASSAPSAPASCCACPAPSRPRPTWKSRCGSSTWRCRSAPT
jgi:hypothetical protein